MSEETQDWREGLPEKFAGAESPEEALGAVLKSYTELERSRSEQPASTGGDGGDTGGVTPAAPAPRMEIPETPPAPELSDDAGVADVLASKGMDPGEFLNRYETDGRLRDSDYEMAKKEFGWTRAMTNEFMDAQVTKRGAMTAEAAKIAGGQEQLQNLLNSAPTYVTDPEELAMYRVMVQDPRQYKAAIRILKQMHSEHAGANGSRPIVEGGGAGAPQSTAGFDNYKDYQEAFAKARSAVAAGKEPDAALMARLQNTPQEVKW